MNGTAKPPPTPAPRGEPQTAAIPSSVDEWLASLAGSGALGSLLGPPREGAFRRVAVVEYPVPGSYALGFVTSTASGEAGEKLGRKVCSVYIPKAVNPVTGYLLLVPEEKITYLTMTPEEAMKMVVSAGALVPDRPE